MRILTGRLKVYQCLLQIRILSDKQVLHVCRSMYVHKPSFAAIVDRFILFCLFFRPLSAFPIAFLSPGTSVRAVKKTKATGSGYRVQFRRASAIASHVSNCRKHLSRRGSRCWFTATHTYARHVCSVMGLVGSWVEHGTQLNIVSRVEGETVAGRGTCQSVVHARSAQFTALRCT